MKSNIKKRVLAVVLCMVLMLSTGISTMADGEVAAGTPAPESGASQEPAAASVEGEAVEGETVEGEQTPAEQSTETQEETPTEPSAAESKDEPAADINSVSGVTELVGSNGIQNEASEQEAETDLTEQEPEVEIVSEATELKQEFTDEAGNVTQRVIANIPEGAFQANASEITMEVNYLDEAAENHVKELMTAALPENEILGDYILYDIKFKVNGEVTEPQKAIAITFEGSGLHIEDTKKANVFYLDPADPEVQDDKDEIVEITQKSEMIENLQNAGQSVENIDEYDLSEISVKEDGTADQILMEGRISTVYGCYVETKSKEVTLIENLDGVKVSVMAPEGAFPVISDKVTMTVESLSEEQKAMVRQQLEKQAEEGQKLKDFVAYDINLWANGQIIQPQVPVSVTFENTGIDADAIVESTGFQLDEKTNEINTVAGKVDSDGTAIMEAEHFTISGTAGYTLANAVSTAITPASENVANKYLPNAEEVTNDWQIVKGKYIKENPEMQSTEDGFLRYQKKIIPTGIENEFYVYLNIEPQMEWSWEEFISRSAVWILNSNCKKDNIEVSDNPTPEEVKHKSSGGHAAKLSDTKDQADNNTTSPYQYHHVRKIVLKGAGKQSDVEMDVDMWYSLSQNSTDSFTILLGAPGSNIYWKIGGVSLINEVFTIPEKAWQEVSDHVVNKGDYSSMGAKALPDTVTDPMGDYIEYIETIESTNGEHEFYRDSKTLTWSGFSEPESSNNPADFETLNAGTDSEIIYRKNAYQLIYKIRLKVEDKGFKSCAEDKDLWNGSLNPSNSGAVNPTNGKTTLLYSSTGENAFQKTTEFEVPEVRGLLYDIELRKVDSTNQEKALSDAEFRLSKDGMEKTDRTDSEGYLKFRNLSWGTYRLSEVSAPFGYMNSYDGEEIILCYTTNKQLLKQDHANVHKCDETSDIRNALYLAGKDGIITNTPDIPEVLEDVPHTKYIDYLGDGKTNPDTALAGNEFYRLYLDVTGIPNVEPEPADIVLILDYSSSMKYQYSTGTRWEAVQKSAEIAVNTLLPEESNNRIAIVWFDKRADEYTVPFTSDKNTLLKSIDSMKPSGGTNYQAAFKETQKVLSASDIKKKYVVFVTDGEPYQWVDEAGAIKDTGTEDAKNYASKEAEKLKGLAGFYTVSVGRDAGKKYLKTSISDKVGAGIKENLEAVNEEELTTAFSLVLSSITKQIADVTIQDTLSDYVEFSDEDGSLVIDHETVTGTNNDFSGAGISLKVSVRNKGDAMSKAVPYQGDYTWTVDFPNKKVSVNLGPEYFLERDVIYTISFNVKLTEKAYTSSPTDIGDVQTDYPGNETSSGKKGYFSNNDATVTYSRVTDNQYSEEVQEYNKPVVQPKVSHTVEKKWNGEEAESINVKLKATAVVNGKKQDVTGEILPNGSKAEVTLTSPTWKYTWNNLPQKYYPVVGDENKNPVDIVYTVEETQINQTQGTNKKYETVIVESKDGLITTITNNELFLWQILKKSSSAGNLVITTGAEFKLESNTGKKTYIGISNKDGVIEWDDVTDSQDIEPDEYTLTETKAPTGYMLSSEYWTVTIGYKGQLATIKSSNGKDVTLVQNPRTGVYECEFLNTPVYELPSTGGSGIFLYMVGGVLLMMAASLLLYKNKSREVLER